MRQAIKIQALKINIHHHVYPLLQKFLSLVINNCLLLYIKVLNKKILPDYIFLYQLLTFFVTFKKENVHFFSAKLQLECSCLDGEKVGDVRRGMTCSNVKHLIITHNS